MEIRDYVREVHCYGILHFDGPPDSLEYICVASINSLIDINSFPFSDGHPFDLQWFDLTQIPYEKMPADDRIWYPLILREKKFKGAFHFGGLEERSIESYELDEVKDLGITH